MHGYINISQDFCFLFCETTLGDRSISNYKSDPCNLLATEQIQLGLEGFHRNINVNDNNSLAQHNVRRHIGVPS